MQSAMVRPLAKDGISCAVIDLRTTFPLDEETILDFEERAHVEDKRRIDSAGFMMRFERRTK